jgi:hypothetical protein
MSLLEAPGIRPSARCIFEDASNPLCTVFVRFDSLSSPDKGEKRQPRGAWRLGYDFLDHHEETLWVRAKP